MNAIYAQWFDWNYGRGDGDPHWIAQDEPVKLEMRETSKSFIVRYGSGKLRKILPKLYHHSRKPRSQWRMTYGNHDRLSFAKIEFTLRDIAT